MSTVVGIAGPRVDRVRPMPGPATTRGGRSLRPPRPEAVRSCELTPWERRFVGARLTRRGRVVAAGTLVALLVLVVGGIGLAGQAVLAGADAAEPVRTRSVLVQPGQTVWEIAESAAPAADVRATVDRIVQLNGLDGAGDLAAGERLRVPVSGGPSR